jgi:hypothetical protein
MSTQTRLDAYLAAELAILQAQEIRGDSGRAQRMADLADVRAQIDKLQAQLIRENARATNTNGGLNYAVANLGGE